MNSWPRRLVIFLTLGVALFSSQGLVSAAPLKWVSHPGYREAVLTVPTQAKTGFTLLRPEQTGVSITNAITYSRAEANQNLLNGCGVAAGDFDGDGLCDLYFAVSEGSNGLFRNQGGWKFSNVTAAAGVGCTNMASKGVVFADINGDNRLDLLVGALGGPNACFLNLGEGRFTNSTAAAGLVSRAGTHSLALADIDGDGDLDLYLANYGENSILRSGGQVATRMVNGRPQVTGRWAKRLKLVDGRLIELGEPDALYLNDSQGVFRAVSWTDGRFTTEKGEALKAEPYDMGLSVMFRDINGDGAPDLYVCNDFQTPDRIWLNDGQGRFRAMADLAVRSLCHFSMGVDFADIDRDGDDDFFVGDMLSRRHSLRMTQMGATNPPPSEVGEIWDRQQVRQNSLNVNRGDGTYENLAWFSGLHASDWSWSVVFLDVDLDGYEDLLVANKHAYDTQDLDMNDKAPAAVGASGASRIGKLLKDFPRLQTPNYLFRNRGGRKFEEIGAEWGFNSLDVSHGIALADLDNDGDLDVAVSCLDRPPLIYRNESPAPRVAVRLRGAAPNTRGIGAKIRVLGGAVPVQSQEMQCGGRYLSADEPIRAFAVGTLTNEMVIEVVWRSGKRSVVTGARPNRLYEIDESSAKAVTALPVAAAHSPLFRDVSEKLGHTHQEHPFSEMERQPLLWRSFSGLGPGVAWTDLNADGRDELVIGGSAGGTTAVFSRNQGGDFQPFQPPALGADLSAFASWTSASGQRTLLAGQSIHRDPATPLAPLLELAAGTGPPNSAAVLRPVAGLPFSDAATGPIAVADIDADGDLDVFVGGRLVPGRYPEPGSSHLFRNEGGALKLDSGSEVRFKSIGLVSGALFSDLNGDGYPDLVLACEWGPPKVFRNDRGNLVEWDPGILMKTSPASPTKIQTLSQLTGWWSGVASGDFDEDGKVDLVVGNWGWNSSYGEPSPEKPLRLFYGDFDGNGSVDLLETEWEEGTGRLVPRRELAWMKQGWPEVRARFSTHRAWAAADVTAVLGDRKSLTREVAAVTLASMVFLNRGDRFEAVLLPEQAQYAPAFGVSVADFDGDGHQDLFLSQNFFALRHEEPRLDAGRGLVLRGDGKGAFRALAGQESGMRIYGEQRGSALSDFDGDGRVDLVVAQNGGATKLFQNVGAQPGLRVRLKGGPANPDAIGASIALEFGDRRGPVREVQSGSGYWSQDSATLVLATPKASSGLWVRWPGGKVTLSPLPAGAKEIQVGLDGQIVARP